jgi:hypothetical protein
MSPDRRPQLLSYQDSPPKNSIQYVECHVVFAFSATERIPSLKGQLARVADRNPRLGKMRGLPLKTGPMVVVQDMVSTHFFSISGVFGF